MSELMERLQEPGARQKLLSDNPLFVGLSGSSLAALAGAASPVSFDKTEQVWKKDELATYALLVVEGAIMPRVTTVPTASPGKVVGLLPLWIMVGQGGSKAFRTGGAVATLETVALRLPYTVLQELMGEMAYAVALSFAVDIYNTDRDGDLAYA